MKNNHRDFLKVTGTIGLGLAGGNILKGYASVPDNQNKPGLDQLSKQLEKSHVQRFNMSGFAAPKIENVRIGIIGLGNRGPGHMNNLSRIVGVEIKALCDLRPERAEAANKIAKGSGQREMCRLFCPSQERNIVW